MNLTPTTPETAAMVAAIENEGGIAAVRGLLKNGYAVDQPLFKPKSRSEKVVKPTALHWAAMHGRVTICKLLLAAGADIHAKVANGDTPLHLAVSSVKPKIVQLLVAAGADVNMPNYAGEIPLQAAAADGFLHTVKLLVAAGANPSYVPQDKREHYMTPFEAAVYLFPNEGEEDPDLRAKKMAVVSYLALEGGQDPDPNRVSCEGRTLLELTNEDERMGALLSSLNTELSIRAQIPDNGLETQVIVTAKKRSFAPL